MFFGTLMLASTHTYYYNYCGKPGLRDLLYNNGNSFLFFPIRLKRGICSAGQAVECQLVRGVSTSTKPRRNRSAHSSGDCMHIRIAEPARAIYLLTSKEPVLPLRVSTISRSRSRAGAPAPEMFIREV